VATITFWQTTPGASGSFAAPPGATSVKFVAYGGGAGGGGLGYGGGGGASATVTLSCSGGDTVYYYNANEVAGLTTNGTGANGEDTWIRLNTNSAPSSDVDGCLAEGGTGPTAVAGTGWGGTIGGSIGYIYVGGDASISQPNYDGGGGGASETDFGKNAGGALGTTDGTPGAGGSPDGGSGGAGNNAGNASDGVQPGGGGGAATSGNLGGTGAGGWVRVTFTYPDPVGGTTLDTATEHPSGLVDFSNGNLTATANIAGNQVKSWTVAPVIKTYTEATLDAHNGGWQGALGLLLSNKSFTSWGGDTDSFGVMCDGEIWLEGVSQGDLGGDIGVGGRLCMAVDRANNLVWVRHNNGNWNNNGSANPATGTGGISISGLPAGDLFFALYIDAPIGAAMTLHSERESWEYTAPAGFEESGVGPSTVYAQGNAFQLVPVGLPTRRWNSADKGAEVDLSNNDLTVTRRGSYTNAYNTARSTVSVDGKTYYEVVVDSGFADSGDYALGIGFADSTFSLSGSGDYLGNAGSTSVAAWSPYDDIYFNTGVTVAWNASPTNVLAPGDVISIAYDRTAKLFWARLNTGYWNNDVGADPATGTGGLSVTALPTTVYAAICIKNGGSGVVTARFDSADWDYAAPSGFVQIGDPSSTSYTLTASAGSFSMTGIAAGLRYDRLLTAAAGSFTMTGVAASLERSYTLVAAAGSFGVTGNDAALLYGRAVVAGAGAFTLTGVAAGLLASRVLTAEVGTFALSGQDAGMLAGRAVTAEAGSFALTGNDATLVYNPVGSYTLVADAGSFALTGNDAALTTSRLLTAEAGSFALDGIAADLIYDGTPIVEPPAGGLSYGGGAAAPSRKRLQQILDEFRSEKRAEREKQLAEKIAKRPRVISRPPQAVVGPEHTSDDDDEEALAWILESTL
jgi:hypothetical protein